MAAHSANHGSKEMHLGVFSGRDDGGNYDCFLDIPNIFATQENVSFSIIQFDFVELPLHG